MTVTTARMTSIVRTMSVTVPRVPRRRGGAAGSGPPGAPASGTGGGDWGPVVVLTAPWCRVLRPPAEPGGSASRAARRGRYDAPTLPMRQPGRRPTVDDVLVVGEALVDIVRRSDGATAEHPGGGPARGAPRRGPGHGGAGARRAGPGRVPAEPVRPGPPRRGRRRPAPGLGGRRRR